MAHICFFVIIIFYPDFENTCIIVVAKAEHVTFKTYFLIIKIKNAS